MTGTTQDRWGPAGTAVLAILGIIGLVFLTDAFPKVGGALILLLVLVWALKLNKQGVFSGL